MIRSFFTAATLAVFLASPAACQTLGLVGNGQSDVTSLLQGAINATPSGGTLILPAGNFRVTSTISITKPITIVGSGFGTQIYEQSDATLFRLTGVNNAEIANLYLGSASVSSSMSIIELQNSNHNRIDNITLLGGNYGLHLLGSILNTIIDLRSGTNFQGFFGRTSLNQYWVYAEPYNKISANANTFIAPVLEGGVNGISINDNGGQGSLTVTGGSIEGVSGAALTFNSTFLPSEIIGTHMEANGTADVAINASSNITLSTVFSLSPIVLSGDTRNVLIEGGVVEHLTIGATTKRIRVQNVTTGITSACPNNIINNNLGTSPYDGTPNVVLSQIGIYCYGL